MVKKYFALVTFLLLALLLAGPVKGELVQLGIPAGQELIKGNELTKVGRDLVALQESYETHVQLRSLEPFKPSNPYLRVVDQHVVVDAVASGEAEDLLAELEALGLQKGATFGRMVSGRLPIEAIEELQGVDSLKFVRPAYMATNVGLVTSQGDVAMRADIARTSVDVDGFGVTVGTLSDSFNCLGGAATDVANGDLPAGIAVLKDETGCGSGSDEGRAMMQLIHDVAPGASQAFHTAFDGMADFAQGIIELANAGADVITDDVFYFAEPMFQDGIIAQAVDQVVAMGIPYFSSAGNNGRNAYESDFRNSGVSGSRGARHDFDPGSEVDDLQTVTFAPGTTTFILQWSAPYASACTGCPGADSDLVIAVYNMDGSLIFASNVGNIGGDPIDIYTIRNSGSGPVQVQLGLELVAGTAPQRVKYWYQGPLTINQHDTASGTVFGHASAAGARAVGAAFYDETPAFGQNPPLLESFSSAGPQRIYFDTSGTPLSPFETRQKPEIVAPDGTNTTFFGSDISEDADSFPNFFCTSAAAPHAAAVAALMLEADPLLTPNEMYQIMQDTAIDMLTPGFDHDSGLGLIDAAAAILRGPDILPVEGTIGTEVEITNVSLGEKTPKVLIGESKCKVTTSTTSSVRCLIKKVKSTNPPGTYDVKITPKGKAFKGQPPIVLPNAFSIMAPDIQAVTTSGNSATLTGLFFGTKKVKAYLVVDGSGKRKKVKVTSLQMNPVTGFSQLEVTVSNKVMKKLESGSYDVIVANKVGSDTFTNGFTID
jgi:hypothetical protein